MLENDISVETRGRLVATALAEGMSVESLLALLIDERQELVAAVDLAESRSVPLSADLTRESVERGFAQSENNDVVDGDTFAASLVNDMAEVERKRRAG